MFRPRENDEIGRIVVERVAIGVMNHLVPGELPSELQLHDVAMQGDLLTVDADELVAALHPAPAANSSTVVTAHPCALDAVALRGCQPTASAGASS